MRVPEITIHEGDCRDVIKTLADCSVDSVVTDPPYALVSIGKRFGADNAATAKSGKTGAYARASAGFMGQKWDTGETAFAVEFWAEVYRVLKPGGHVIAFAGTRTYHRLACAVEDAGFEIRDMISWIYGSGFPKSHDVSKGIDKAAGVAREVTREGQTKATDLSGRFDLADSSTRERRDAAATPEAAQWSGWGTALKPACEPCVLARKPLGKNTVAANVLAYGTGAVNVDGCRIEGESTARRSRAEMGYHGGNLADEYSTGSDIGRWPANVIHDGSDEVMAAFPQSEGQRGDVSGLEPSRSTGEIYGKFEGRLPHVARIDSGSAARFFYTSKADANDRLGSKHPTVKPTDLMAYLIRLVTPPGGVVLDPFAGSGSTGVAAVFEGMNAILIERESNYAADARRRVEWAKGNGRLTSEEKTQPVAKALGIEQTLF